MKTANSLRLSPDALTARDKEQVKLINAELKRKVCSECGAVEHGNLFCNTCRQCMNTTIGCSLPPWPYKAEKPCGAEEVQRFMARLEASN